MLLLKGVKYMDKKAAILLEENGKDILKLELTGSEQRIDFNSSDQSELRNVFYAVISELLNNDFEFEFKTAEGYSKTLYIEVADEYVKQLNNEMRTIRRQSIEDFEGMKASLDQSL